MTSKADIKHQIARMEDKLKATRQVADNTRSPVGDTLSVVVPMMEDLLVIMRETLEFASEHSGHDHSD